MPIACAWLYLEMRRAEPAIVDRGIVEFVQLLARAAHQFRTYPASSPLCTDAIAACHAAFIALTRDEPLVIRATAQLLVDDTPLPTDPVVDHELRRPLRAHRVASIEIDRHTSARDWTHLCATLALAARASREAPTIAERLLDVGVSAITVRMTPRPEVFDVGAPAAPVLRVLDLERARHDEATSTAPAQYLYPPDKGWVRVDPAVGDASISLVDLTLLVNDPEQLALMLARLVDDASASESAANREPLRDRYDDVVMLIGALEPQLARLLFAKLARSVLDLDPERRRALLRRSILPHLLDHRVDGQAILAEFPDVALAEALSLLLDLEAASPQVLPLALEQLRLSPERQSRMRPLLEATLDGRPARAADRWASAGFDQHAEKLIRVDAATTKNFGEFAAFDLSIDAATASAIAGTSDAIAAGDPTDAWLGCAINLARLEPNPVIVSSVLARALPLLRGFVRDQRWPELTRYLARIGDLAHADDPARADAAAAVRDALTRFCDRQAIVQLAALAGSDAGRTYATMIVAALGPSVVPAWLDALATPADRQFAMRLRPLMHECARAIGAAIAERLPQLRADVASVAVSVLGYTGGGHEAAIASRVNDPDEALCRESLRALARIASAKAAALIVSHLEQSGHIQPAAEEALWRLPAAVAMTKTRELLARREFVSKHPQAAARLLERAAHSGDADLPAVLETLAPLRFWFWSPALARVGAKAHGLM